MSKTASFNDSNPMTEIETVTQPRGNDGDKHQPSRYSLPFINRE